MLLGFAGAHRLHRAVDHLVCVARRLLARGQPHARLPRRPSPARLRWCGSRPGAGPRFSTASRSAACSSASWALMTKVFPGALARRGDVRSAARAVRLLERRRADGGARRAAAALACGAALRHAGGQRAGVAGARAALHLPDAVLLARSAARAAARPRAFGSRSCRCACAALLPLVAAASASAPVIGWTFARDALSADRIPLAARSRRRTRTRRAAPADGRGAARSRSCRRVSHRPPPSPAARPPDCQAARCSTIARAASRSASARGVAAAPGGIEGQMSDGMGSAHQPAAASTPANTPDRLTATSSVRARYWGEAVDVFDASPAVGAGAGAFVVARTRYRHDKLAVRHAHGYAVQTLADLGLIGLATLAAGDRRLGGRGAARDRAAPARPRSALRSRADRDDDDDHGRVLSSGSTRLIDWTWFVPANAAVALLCAGWVAGRQPLRMRLSTRETAIHGRVPVSAEAPAACGFARGRRGGGRRAWRGLVTSWAALQPVRAAHAEDRAIDALRSATTAPLRARAHCGAPQPVSLEPLWLLAFVADARGDSRAASQALERAARLQPANAEAWRRLGRYRLSVLEEPEKALNAFQVAYFLDPPPSALPLTCSRPRAHSRPTASEPGPPGGARARAAVSVRAEWRAHGRG